VKNPRLAALLSLLFTGMGQMYNGQMRKGALFSIIQLVNFSLIPVGIGVATVPIFALYAAFDAFRVADLMFPRDEEAEDSAKSKGGKAKGG
jgi:TM2 domain-containing membrane protein YozV